MPGGLCPPLFLADDICHSFVDLRGGAWQLTMVMRRQRPIPCVHDLWECGSEGYLLGVCFKLNFLVQKAPRHAISPLVLTLDKLFSPARFCLFPRASPFSLDGPLSTKEQEDPLLLLDANTKTLHDTPYAAPSSNMIPLAPTIALAFLSFTCSVFVILRTVLPILPPHPLSRRVAPVRRSPQSLFSSPSWCIYPRLVANEGLQSEFGLPNFKKLAPADKTHLWIAACDLLALVIFIWQVVAESLGGPTDYAVGLDPLASVRLWFASTIRATCIFVIIAVTLLHVRLARPIDFGKFHWLIWAPGLLLVITSTAIAGKYLYLLFLLLTLTLCAGVLAGANFPSFFVGMIAYSSSLAFLSIVVFASLVGTLVTIRRNLTSTAGLDDSWPPMRQVDEKRQSFAQEDIDGLKDGSSWITSDAGSCHGGSVSAFSFSTHQTHARKSSNSSSNLHHGSNPPKSTFWFNSETPGRLSPVPPVPPLPAPYRPTSPTSAGMCDDPDPFRRTIGNHPRVRNGSQASWLTEPSIAPSTITTWSFPATHPASRPNTPNMSPQSTADLHAELIRPVVPSRPQTPAISSTQVLGGYGFSDVSLAEKQAGLAAVPEGDLDTNVPRVMTWFISVLLPCVSFSASYIK